MGSEGVDSAMKDVAQALKIKILLAIGSSLGLSGFAIIILSLLLILIVIGGLVASSSHSSSTSLGGQFSCSPTGQVNTTNFKMVFSVAGVLAGHEDEIIAISQEKGIDPVLFAAITLHESGYGKSHAIQAYHNPGGLMNPQTGSLFRFVSLSEGLQSMGRTLYNRIRVDGLTTIEKLGSVYAPLGAKNDPKGLNKNWVPTVTSIASDLGGLTMNCEPQMGGIDDSGEPVSGVNLVDVGRKWIGNSTYVFGGGRNPYDVAHGLFDCSSFVYWAFKEAGKDLGPVGTTDTLKRMGKTINPKNIQPGDLVFFNTYKIDGHVGIYAGNGKFIGSQSSTGVAFADMTTGYWHSKFNGRVKRL